MRTALMLALWVGLATSSQAQQRSPAPRPAGPSAAIVAQTLAKLEEDMAADPNVRIAAFEEAMRSTSSAVRERAMSLAMAGTDAALVSLALRHRVCAAQNVTVMHGYPPEGTRVSGSFNWLQAKQHGLVISQCDPVTGRFQVTYPPLLQRATREQPAPSGQGSVNRRSVQMFYPVSQGSTPQNCVLSLTLDQQKDLAGSLSCNDGGWTFGPVSAAFYL